MKLINFDGGKIFFFKFTQPDGVSQTIVPVDKVLTISDDQDDMMNIELINGDSFVAKGKIDGSIVDHITKGK